MENLVRKGRDSQEQFQQLAHLLRESNHPDVDNNRTTYLFSVQAAGLIEHRKAAENFYFQTGLSPENIDFDDDRHLAILGAALYAQSSDFSAFHQQADFSPYESAAVLKAKSFFQREIHDAQAFRQNALARLGEGVAIPGAFYPPLGAASAGVSFISGLLDVDEYRIDVELAEQVYYPHLSSGDGVEVEQALDAMRFLPVTGESCQFLQSVAGRELARRQNQLEAAQFNQETDVVADANVNVSMDQLKANVREYFNNLGYELSAEEMEALFSEELSPEKINKAHANLESKKAALRAAQERATFEQRMAYAQAIGGGFQLLGSVADEFNSESLKKVAVVGVALTQVYACSLQLSQLSSVMSMAAVNPVLGILSAGLSILSLFRNKPQEDPLMPMLRHISKQINHMHEDMLNQFDHVNDNLQLIYHGICAQFYRLHYEIVYSVEGRLESIERAIGEMGEMLDHGLRELNLTRAREALHYATDCIQDELPLEHISGGYIQVMSHLALAANQTAIHANVNGLALYQAQHRQGDFARYHQQLDSILSHHSPAEAYPMYLSRLNRQMTNDPIIDEQVLINPVIWLSVSKAFLALQHIARREVDTLYDARGRHVGTMIDAGRTYMAWIHSIQTIQCYQALLGACQAAADEINEAVYTEPAVLEQKGELSRVLAENRPGFHLDTTNNSAARSILDNEEQLAPSIKRRLEESIRFKGETGRKKKGDRYHRPDKETLLDTLVAHAGGLFDPALVLAMKYHVGSYDMLWCANMSNGGKQEWRSSDGTGMDIDFHYHPEGERLEQKISADEQDEQKAITQGDTEIQTLQLLKHKRVTTNWPSDTSCNNAGPVQINAQRGILQEQHRIQEQLTAASEEERRQLEGNVLLTPPTDEQLVQIKEAVFQPLIQKRQEFVRYLVGYLQNYRLAHKYFTVVKLMQSLLMFAGFSSDHIVTIGNRLMGELFRPLREYDPRVIYDNDAAQFPHFNLSDDVVGEVQGVIEDGLNNVGLFNINRLSVLNREVERNVEALAVFRQSVGLAEK